MPSSYSPVSPFLFDRCLLVDVVPTNQLPTICKKKTAREIQAARDVERDMLSVNGVLVKGSEGYPVVVGKVKRELARLVEPVAGSDAVAGGSAAPTGSPVPGGGVKRQPAPSLSQVWSRELYYLRQLLLLVCLCCAFGGRGSFRCGEAGRRGGGGCCCFVAVFTPGAALLL